MDYYVKMCEICTFLDLITDIYGNRFIFGSHKSLLVSFYLVFQTFKFLGGCAANGYPGCLWQPVNYQGLCHSVFALSTMTSSVQVRHRDALAWSVHITLIPLLFLRMLFDGRKRRTKIRETIYISYCSLTFLCLLSGLTMWNFGLLSA